jgi:transposase
MTTKILALTDALGNLVRFVLLPGHRFDTVGVAPLIDGLTFGGFIADKAFDSNSIIADLNERGAEIVISQHPRRASPLPIDAELYKWRHLIENFFCKLKEFKRIAMRADKTDQSFAAINVAGFADIDRVAELASACLPDSQRGLRALGNQPPLLLGQGRIQVEHEGIGIAAEFCDDNGTRCAIRPATNATSRDNRSSFDTRTLHLAVCAAASAAAS